MSTVLSRPRVFTIVQVAEDLQVSTKTVRRWIAEHHLIAHRLGRQLRITEGDLRAFLTQRRG